MEFLTLGVFATWLTTLIAQLPVGHKVPFFFLSHAIGGIIHIQICLSHFSRDVFDGVPKNNEWIEMQLSGTMDIECPIGPVAHAAAFGGSCGEVCAARPEGGPGCKAARSHLRVVRRDAAAGARRRGGCGKPWHAR